jgi:hypothetical protein
VIEAIQIIVWFLFTSTYSLSDCKPIPVWELGNALFNALTSVSNELIIDASNSEVVIALLNDKRLVELNREKTNSQFAVGDIYLGRVRKVMPGLLMLATRKMLSCIILTSVRR